MENITNKIIKEDDAIATIEFKEGLSEDIINKIDEVISKNYDQECEYIIKIDNNHYKGDMACLSALAWDVIEELKYNKYFDYISSYMIYNKTTDELEDFLED